MLQLQPIVDIARPTLITSIIIVITIISVHHLTRDGLMTGLIVI